MKKQDFFKDVMSEIDSLKRIATKEELDNLDFDSLNPRKYETCIYGQMTGSCQSHRAKELMNTSCIRTIASGGVNVLMNRTFTEIKDKINGPNEGQIWGVSNSRNYTHLSALEGYIAMKGAKNKEIIKYLRGEVDTLKL